MKKRSFVRELSFVCALTASGCGAALVGAGAAGAVAYSAAKLRSTAPQCVPDVQRATIDALDELSLPVMSQHGDTERGRVEARYSDGAKLTVELKSKGASITEVSIRVGTFGDQGRYRQLLDAVNRHLANNAVGTL